MSKRSTRYARRSAKEKRARRRIRMRNWIEHICQMRDAFMEGWG